MKLLRILLHLGCVVFTLAHVSMDDYFDEKLKQSKIEIAKLYFRDEPPVRRKLYNVKWDNLWQQDFGKERPFMVNAFDKVLLIEGNRAVVLSFGAPPSNQTLSQEIIPTRNDRPIKFIRTIVWKNVLYLLICQESGSCSLYTGTDNLQLRHRQSMQHKGYPTDASFFVRANRLYLVVADNSGKFIVPSLIYHWRGTYMDVVAEVMTTAAVSVTTFKHKQSTIIVFIQNDETTPDIGSVVYEFKEVSPDRIQFVSTFDPTSVHYYYHAGFNFILIVNERRPSNLFWWDGHELLNWEEIPEIKQFNLFHVLSIEEETFFFVGRNNTLQLYKFENATDCNLSSSMKLPNGERAIDAQIRVDRSTITMVLVIMNERNVYTVESWELRIQEIPSDYSTKETDVLSKHLAELVEILQRRKPLIEEAESMWPSLLSADEDLTITEPVVLPPLTLESGTIRNIDVFVAEDVITPSELRTNVETLIHDIDDTLATFKNLPTSNNSNSFNGDIIVDGDAFIESLQIDKMNVNFLNGIDLRSWDVVESNKTQGSSSIGKNIVAHDVEIDSICGIPFQYWALNNDTSRLVVDIAADKIEFSNDTVFLHSNISLESLSVKTLNDTNVDEFFDDLFIIGQNQIIKGNITYDGMLKIQNLTMQTLNGEPFENYMTASTDQNFDSFVMKSFKVDELYADSINGVPVSEAARISTKNVIKGDVKVARLQVTEKLTADTSFVSAESQQHQIYSNVTVHGNVKIGTLDMDRYTTILLNNEKLNLNDIFQTFWTKSTDQTIKNNITFQNNLIIDHLRTRYLNGFTEDEYLYTDVTTIPESFQNLHFENVRINDTFFAEGENNSFFDDAPESLIIQERLEFKQLRTKQLLTEVFNGQPITDILNGKPSVFPGDTNFSAIRAKRVNAEVLEFLFFNDADNTTFFEGGRMPEEGQRAESTRMPALRVENLNVDKINDIDMKRFVSLKNLKMSDLRNLIIDGDLTVKGDLKIDLIDDQSTETYLRNMVEEDIVLNRELTIDELIVHNATLEFLHGYNLKNLFDGVLSKSREQTVLGQFSFYKITTDRIDSKFINNKDTSELKWIDEPVSLTGNIVFEDLFVEGDVVTKILNDRDVNELYNNLLNPSVTNIKDLKVDGNVSWNYSSTNSSSLSFLFQNAMTKTTNQSVSGDVIFENDVSASRIEGESTEIIEISDIIADTVVDDEDFIQVIGEKMFEKNLVVNDLTITGDTNIPVINNVSIVEFNNSVARKDREETITGPINFLDEVTIDEVLVDDHDVPLDGLVFATDILPKVTFKELVVLGDVHLKNLDGTDFDKFIKNRITIDGDHEIFSDVQFDGIVEVTENATVTRINGIEPSDLVLDETKGTQVISGSKIFEEDVVVHGDIYSRFFNELDVSTAYSDRIQTDEDVEIIGDLIFKSAVKVPQNVSVSKRMNGINLHTVLDDLEEETYKTLQAFARNESVREESIRESSLISSTLRNIFSYIEEEEQLQIQAPNIKKVDVVYYEQITKLNMFGEEAGSSCGLPENCSCPTEYVAELTKDGCRIRRTNGTTIVRNYHEFHSTFGVNVITNTVSSSRECTSNRSQDEYVKISWMKSGLVETGDILANVRETSAEVHGLIKDASVFVTHDNAAFVVLAIYYDTLSATHRTNSAIYKIDFETNLLSLHQKLYTDGAWAIEIFKTNHPDVYLLLGCFGDSETSYLYKLNPLTSKFVTVRTFGGKTRNVKSLRQEKEHFVLLDDYDTNAVNIFYHDPESDYFHSYQSLFHDSRVEGIECFYSDEYGQSDSFVIVTTENDQFYIYEYMYAQKFQMKVQHQIDDLQTMVPFHYLEGRYIFAGTSTNSTILRIVHQGPH